MSEADIRRNHRQRALNAMAQHICCTQLTDGFCSPQHGHLMSNVSECRNPCKARSGQNCVQKAVELIHAMELHGCYVVWEFDPALKIETERVLKEQIWTGEPGQIEAIKTAAVALTSR